MSKRPFHTIGDMFGLSRVLTDKSAIEFLSGYWTSDLPLFLSLGIVALIVYRQFASVGVLPIALGFFVIGGGLSVFLWRRRAPRLEEQKWYKPVFLSAFIVYDLVCMVIPAGIRVFWRLLFG